MNKVLYMLVICLTVTSCDTYILSKDDMDITCFKLKTSQMRLQRIDQLSNPFIDSSDQTLMANLQVFITYNDSIENFITTLETIVGGYDENGDHKNLGYTTLDYYFFDLGNGGRILNLTNKFMGEVHDFFPETRLPSILGEKIVRLRRLPEISTDVDIFRNMNVCESIIFLKTLQQQASLERLSYLIWYRNA